MPVYDSLIRDTVFIVQNLSVRVLVPRIHTCRTAYASATDLENLRECLDNTGVFIRVYLDCVDERDLGLGAVTERFEDVCKVLYHVRISRGSG